MKKLVLILFTITAMNAYATSPIEGDDDFDYDQVANQLEKCLASATNIEAKRACINTCYNDARNTMEGNMCAYQSSEIERTEYQRVYNAAIKATKEEIAAADEYSIDDAKETLARYEAYNAILPSYMEARCKVEGLAMLGGTGETSIYVGCQSAVYKEAVSIILGQ